MVIFLYGPDSYRLRAKAKEIKNQFLEKYSGLTLRYFDFSQKEAETEFLDFIDNLSIFESKKMALLEPLSAFEIKFKKKILPAIESLDLNIIIIDSEIESEKDVKAEWKFLLEPPIKSQKFDLLNNSQLAFFIKKEAESMGISLNAKIVNHLIKNFGSDTWAIHNEIEKIRLYPELPLISEQVKKSIFSLIDGLAYNPSSKDTFLNLERNFVLGEDPAAVFNLLVSEVRNLLLAKESPKQFEGLKLHPFVIRKIKSRTQLFNLEQLRDFYRQLGDFDISVKSGKLAYDDCLVSLAVTR